MKQISMIFIALLSLIVLLSGCYSLGDFNTADPKLYDKKIVDAYLESSEALYLAADGTLYSPGADIDASRYVTYTDKSKGIVANNVISFGTIFPGGYYITANHDLFIYNRNSIELYNYVKKKHHSKIKENVKAVAFGDDCAAYIDMDGRLFYIGEFEGQIYTFEKPKHIEDKVSCLNAYQNQIIYCKSDGRICGIGLSEYSNRLVDVYNASRLPNECNSVQLNDCFLLCLQNENLYFTGNMGELLGEKLNDEIISVVLQKNVIDYDSDKNKVLTVTAEHIGYVFGKCLSNDERNTVTPEYSYYNSHILIENVFGVSDSGSDFCFITDDNQTAYFGFCGSWHFVGNSNDSTFVGINNTPVTWVNQKG